MSVNPWFTRIQENSRNIHTEQFNIFIELQAWYDTF